MFIQKLILFIRFDCNKNVKYEKTGVTRIKGMSRLQAFPTDSTIESFANEYKEARDNNNEKNVKFIQYNNADHPRTKQLREKIREKLFDDFFAGDVETKPFLVGERVVLDDAIAILDGSTIKFTKDLHNGDEVTVEAELTRETNTSVQMRRIPGSRMRKAFEILEHSNPCLPQY